MQNALINIPKLRLLLVPEQDSSLMDKVIMFIKVEALKYMRFSGCDECQETRSPAKCVRQTAWLHP